MAQPIQQDRHFSNGMAERFARNIYGSAKGRLRLKILRDRMLAELPLQQPGLSVLDAGGGLGQVSCWLARQGHQVLLAEPAGEMLEYAAQRLQRFGVQPLQASIQQLPEALPPAQQQFDLVVCHAVLEWLHQPLETLQSLLQHLKPGGHLSLMFFNADALLLANILRGNWQRVLEKVPDQTATKGLAGKGRGKRLTPISPLQPDTVLNWLQQQGMELRGVTGVRVFNDYLRLKLPPEATAARLLEIERRYCQQEPWWRLGRYILVHASSKV
ncbi:methyltransferase domain-containing protein [Marinospirillum alkaliphilum]|uniref:tRNA 5-carboxymethoxyuridine methyltransferase n=1 Tax=Marinospirillum alkaliphilum DSM 21637 TaxID=1122209 RepID=A0A1K1W2R4_9GAMM|nr:methyltransferase domain-containing protein [Marinospirillum alkaliphilum]SFX31403.1 S-adenosylmethionine-dependent methyltransferase [Marinospirillum alkaliphilum DSM 21637]